MRGSEIIDKNRQKITPMSKPFAISKMSSFGYSSPGFSPSIEDAKIFAEKAHPGPDSVPHFVVAFAYRRSVRFSQYGSAVHDHSANHNARALGRHAAPGRKHIDLAGSVIELIATGAERSERGGNVTFYAHVTILVPRGICVDASDACGRAAAY